MRKLRKIFLICSILIVSLSTAFNIYAIEKSNIIKNEAKNEKLNLKNEVNFSKAIKIEEEKSMQVQSKDYTTQNIKNILLVGKDSVNKYGRSDSMIILTIDNLNKSIKLTSLARDTLVKIPGKGYEKLNHAYAYGGIELLISTIKENFNLDIKNYAQIDFKSFIEVIDLLGGVDVNVDSYEVSHLNEVINNSYRYANTNQKVEHVVSSGVQTLNGYQALAYARIRKIDTIYNRDERQREVLTSLASKISSTPITKYPVIIAKIIPYVNVNISPKEIMELAFIVHELANYDINQLEIPVAKYREGGRISEGGAWVIKWNKEKNLEILNNFIYNKIIN